MTQPASELNQLACELCGRPPAQAGPFRPLALMGGVMAMQLCRWCWTKEMVYRKRERAAGWEVPLGILGWPEEAHG